MTISFPPPLPSLQVFSYAIYVLCIVKTSSLPAASLLLSTGQQPLLLLLLVAGLWLWESLNSCWLLVQCLSEWAHCRKSLQTLTGGVSCSWLWMVRSPSPWVAYLMPNFLSLFLNRFTTFLSWASLGQQGMGSLSRLSSLPFEHHAWLEKMKLSSALPQQWEEKRLRCGMDKQSTQDTVQ